MSASRPCDDPRRGCFDAPGWLLTFVRARNVLSIPLRAARLAMSYLIENTPYHLCHTDRIDYSKFELSARVHDGWDWGTTGSTAATGVGSKTETRLESTEAARRRRVHRHRAPSQSGLGRSICQARKRLRRVSIYHPEPAQSFADVRPFHPPAQPGPSSEHATHSATGAGGEELPHGDPLPMHAHHDRR